MGVTIRDIAQELDIDISTVSRCLNNSPQVSEKTRMKVLSTARHLGYRRDARAQALRTGKSGIVGVVVGDIVNPFFAQLADQIEKKARALDLRIMICNGGEDPFKQEQAVAALLEQHVDGLLLTPAGSPTSILRSYVAEIPTVAIDRSLDVENVDTVVADDTQAITELMQYLKNGDYTSAVVISGPYTTSTGRIRQRLLQQGLGDIGVKTRTVNIAYQEESGEKAIAELIQESIPDLVLCAAGVITLGVIEGLRSRGIRVGVDVDIVSFDRLAWLSAAIPTLITIDTKIAEMADLGMQILQQRIAGYTGAPLIKTVTSQLVLPETSTTGNSW
ncbi:LacI family DNA-binding transcriptional regulator [uncultured Arcanobacterium sp.]|uniref:LacI family DNA-binding transcriptional regulator n=1 Tax=uncultured Arcanobacterium sp. TaxID=487520 RepID=UPI00262F81CA|nr:LacI family DNA-binding transcriptional regulator [uncultured Arcanobacterium sp.]